MEITALPPGEYEFSLVLTPHPPDDTGKMFEMGVSIWTTKTLHPGRTFYPNQGVIKLDKLEVYGQLQENDVRHKFGCIDEIKTIENGKVRHCNWVRFLRPCSDFDKVNVVGVKVKGSPVFQVVKTVTSNSELLVYFDEEENGTIPLKIDDMVTGTSETMDNGKLGEKEKIKLEISASTETSLRHDEQSVSSEILDSDSTENVDCDSDDEPIDVVDGDCSPLPFARNKLTHVEDHVAKNNGSVSMGIRCVAMDNKSVSIDNREMNSRSVSPVTPPMERSARMSSEYMYEQSAASASQYAGFYSAQNKSVAAYFTSMLMAQEAARASLEWHHRQQERLSPGSQRDSGREAGFGKYSPNSYRVPTIFSPYASHPLPQKRETLSPPASQSIPSPTYREKDNQFALPNAIRKNSSPMMPFLPTPWSVTSPDLAMRQTVISPISYGYPSPNKMLSPLSASARGLKMPADRMVVEEEMKLSPSDRPGSSEESHNTSKSSTISGKSSSSTSSPKTPVKRNRERTWLPCEVCNKKFDRPSLLRRHMRTHTGEKPHVCDVCGKAFSTSSSLNTHRRIHSGEKPHQCRVCGKRFTASSNLYYHRMTHNKEKPHKCTLCSKSFPTPGDLKSHMYVHNGSWPYRCEICERGFSKQTNLKNHLLLHSGDKPHECKLCGKRFALQCNLRTHSKTHEGEPQEECFKCGQIFLTQMQCLSNGYCKTCTKTLSVSSQKPECGVKKAVKQDAPKPFKSITDFLKPDEKKSSDTRPVGVFRYPFLGPPMNMSAYSTAFMSASQLSRIPHPDIPLGAPNVPPMSYASYMSAMPSMIPVDSYPHRPRGINAKTLQGMVHPGSGMVHCGPGTSWPNVVANTY